MQILCKYGHTKYIGTLLDYGACLETASEPVYHENSPFYLASMYGQVEVVRELFMYEPSMSCACIAAPLGETQFELECACSAVLICSIVLLLASNDLY